MVERARQSPEQSKRHNSLASDQGAGANYNEERMNAQQEREQSSSGSSQNNSSNSSGRVRRTRSQLSAGSAILCPFLKFIEQNAGDEEQIRFQLDINNDMIDFAERLGISKSLNKKIMPDN
jgi:hypothetical protein